MKKYNSYEEEKKDLLKIVKEKFRENDEKNFGKEKGCDGIHTVEYQRICTEFNLEWQRIADKWGVELKCQT